MGTPRSYYNEIDSAACAILRQLIADGVIAPGDVDSRSIKEVTADDIRGYTQCHWFAGGGLWSVAARLAGWPDSRPLWSASCPCQPISAAGKRLGADDPRHLWPDLYRIYTAALDAGFAAPVLVGEQVAGALGYNWFDGVRADLAREKVAARTVDFPAGAVDAPQQRNRLYWIAVADAESFGKRNPNVEGSADTRQRARPHSARDDERNRLDDGRAMARTEGQRSGGDVAWRGSEGRAPVGLFDEERGSGADVRDGRSVAGDHGTRERGRSGEEGRASSRSQEEMGGDIGQRIRLFGGGTDDTRSMVDADSQRRKEQRGLFAVREEEPRFERSTGRNGTYWSDAEWIICHDGKARRAQPGIRLLVNGLPGRVDLWRVGGNAIVPQAAAEVLAAFLEAEAIQQQQQFNAASAA